MMKHRVEERGFTLVELIVVMVITGILGGIVAIFIRAPVQGYVDSARRAEMTDIADTALRRISRDLRLALPNSVRVTLSGGNYYLEFLPTTGGGRYRVAAPGNILDFTAADNSFEVLGGAPAFAAADSIVIYNLGISGASAYDVPATNRAQWSSTAASTINISPSFKFPFDSPGHRFQVIATPVTYVCAPVAGGSGQLTRWWGYPIQAAQPQALPSGASSAILADKVSACSFTYDPVMQQTGLVTLQLSITESGESVNLYSATHVSNLP
jgi:MSHA biogenesis protein MshO